MSQNIISQSILGSRLNFNQNFPNNSSIINSSRVTENQIKTFPIPTQFPILPHKDWICTKCSNNNTKGTYSCKNCGQSIDTTMARLHSNTTVGQPLSEGSSALNTGSIVPTPFGLLHKFSVPDPKSFIFDATKGYFHDTTTGFFYDKNSDYYYNPKSNKWMFWCSKYSTYIDCSGGDVALKRSLQEEEYDLQQKRNSEKLNDSISVTSGSLAVQRRSENIMDDWMDLVKRVGAESSVKATTHSLNINSSNPQTEKARDNETSEREEKDLKGVINANAQKNIRDCILQNEKSLIDLYELLAQETDPKSIEKIQSQIDSFMSTTHSLQKLLDMLSRGNKIESPETQKPTSSSAIITPQFKRHITTKTIQNDDNCDYPRTIQENTFSSQFDKSASFLRRNVYEKQKDFGRTSEKSNISLRDAILEGKRTAFDEHIEQVERLRNSIGTTTKGGNKLNWSDTKGIALHKENNFEEQIRSMVDQQVEKQWTLSSSNSRSSHNRSPERNSSRRSRSRHRSRSRRRSRSRANRRSRSKNRRSSPSRRKRSRSRVYTRSHSRSRHNDKDDDEIEIISQHLTSSYSRMNRTSSRSPQPPPVLPMVFSPPPSKFVRRSEDVNSGIKEVLFNNSNPVRRVEDSVLTPQHDPVNFANMQNASSFFSGSINRHGMNSSFPGSSFPLPPPTLIQVGKSVIQQSKFTNTPGVPPNAVQNKFLNSHFNNQRIPPYQSVPDVLIICSNCGKDGHSREGCPELNKTTLYQLPKNIPSQNRVIRNELESNNVTSTENNLPVGLCLNCGRYGHSQIGCLLPRITDNELQKKIRKAEDRQRLEQLDKLKIKRKAEKYTVRRKDPFIQRLRAVAPYGKITKEHVRLTCQRCSSLGHNWNECAREEVPRSTVKLINEKVGEFIKIFFVHLNEDNLVDFSKKFELFLVMDGIEKSGTVDPVGLQLQTRCNRGIVTKGDLRDLCTNCATLGHVPGDCTQMIACSKQHYEKMLTLVEAYRCLVKEGNGNFFLPRLEYTQNQQIPHNSSDNINNNSDTKTPDILILDSDEAFSSSKRKK